MMPVVSGRFRTLNGKTLDELKEQHFPRRMLENAELSWADAAPAGDKVIEGKWWKDANAQELAVGDGTAKRLNLKIGSPAQLEVGDRDSESEGGGTLSCGWRASGEPGELFAALGTAEG